MKPLGLYLHIPFCAQKCHYCDFNSYAGLARYHQPYVKALIQEMDTYQGQLGGHEVHSIFFGGGTPSLLEAGLFQELMEALRQRFALSSAAEVTIEANPGTLTGEKLAAYYQSGVNRLSIGLQACQPHLLETLGRIHSYQEFLANLETARTLGFTNISADLMFALPGQSLDQWRETLQAMAALDLPHLSAYSLIWEEGTLFEKWLAEKRLAPLEEEEELDMYHETIAFLTGQGYDHYEISNFARPGHRCRHNLIYWRNEEYLGLGAGAHSSLEQVRFHNVASPETYIRLLAQGASPVLESTPSGLKDQVSETMFLGLRMMEGISISEFTRRFGVSPGYYYKKEMDKLIGQGLLETAGDQIRLTSRGIDLSNLVFQEFLLD